MGRPVAPFGLEQPGGLNSARGEAGLIILSFVELAPRGEGHLAVLMQVGRSLIILLIIQKRELLMLHGLLQLILLCPTGLPPVLPMPVHAPPLLACGAVRACPLPALLALVECYFYNATMFLTFQHYR